MRERHDSRPVPAEVLKRRLDVELPGSAWRDLLEPLLVEIPEPHADALMMLLEESRGAWALLLTGSPGQALFVGSALSGTVPALAALGWKVLVLDPSRARGRLARRRDREYAPGRVRHVQARGPGLPLVADAVDLVVREDSGPGLDRQRMPSTAELRRVSRGEAVHVADNRLAYKRASGQRGKFHRHGPLSWLRQVAFPEAGAATLRSLRQSLGGGAFTRAWSLYPDAREFSHVVSLEGNGPRLTVGPRERANAAKVIGKALGLFPVLAPSFVVTAGPRRATRLDRALAALAERLGEPDAQLDQLVATRSNAALVLTSPEGVRMEEEARPRRGAWAVHVALSPGKRRLVARHQRWLREARERFPSLHLPEPLFEGELEGVRMVVSRRLPGWTATHVTDDPERTARLARSLTRALADLVVRPARPFSPSDFEDLLSERLLRVARQVRVARTAARVRRAHDRLRERLVGEVFPLVFHHADLRAKHVMVAADGSFAGALDLGSAEGTFLPLVDLLHHLGHQRKQVRACSSEQAWHALRSPSTRAPHEEACLRAHQQDLGLSDQLLETLLEAYPLLVAGMAERNWDWSRPAWIHREFGY